VRPVGSNESFFGPRGHSCSRCVSWRYRERVRQAAAALDPVPRRHDRAMATPQARRRPALDRPSCARGDGPGPPFYCVHPIGGTVLCYVPWRAGSGSIGRSMLGGAGAARRSGSRRRRSRAWRRAISRRCETSGAGTVFSGWLVVRRSRAYEMACRLAARGRGCRIRRAARLLPARPADRPSRTPHSAERPATQKIRPRP